jgi:hypothetical protein
MIACRKRRSRIGRARKWVIAMPLHLERIAWMPSPPLAPDDGPIDMDHLRVTLGDTRLEREVLTMFSAQAASLIGSLAALPADAGALAHRFGTRDRRIRRRRCRRPSGSRTTERPESV